MLQLRSAPTTQGGTVESLLDIGRQLVPKNIIMAAATSQVLPLSVEDTAHKAYLCLAEDQVNQQILCWPAVDYTDDFRAMLDTQIKIAFGSASFRRPFTC